MSLTSYRAAPPRDKDVRALGQGRKSTGATPKGRRSVRSENFLRRQPGAHAPRVRGLCINAGLLWKGPRRMFWRILSGGTCMIAGKSLPTGDGKLGGDLVADSFDFIVVGGGSGGCAV